MRAQGPLRAVRAQDPLRSVRDQGPLRAVRCWGSFHSREGLVPRRGSGFLQSHEDFVSSQSREGLGSSRSHGDSGPPQSRVGAGCPLSPSPVLARQARVQCRVSVVQLSRAPGATMAPGWGGETALRCSPALGCGLQDAACAAPLLLCQLADGELPGKVALLMAPSAVAAAPLLSWSAQASGEAHVSGTLHKQAQS